MTKEVSRKTINLPLPKLLKSLVEMEIEDYYFDLHNDYECYRLTYDAEKRHCCLFFKQLADKDNFIDITLVDATIASYSFTLDEEPLHDFRTIDTFYRGRFEDNNGLREFDDADRSLYYLTFYRGIELEVFASGLQISFGKSFTG